MPYNILVVDDSAVMRSMIIRTLKLSGLALGEIHQAGDGLQGLACLHAESVDAVLVDLNMPVMPGDEMIDRLRADPATADLPVMVVSTESSETRVAELGAKGVAFIHKPFSPEQLRDGILRMMGSSDDGSTLALVDGSGDLDF